MEKIKVKLKIFWKYLVGLFQETKGKVEGDPVDKVVGKAKQKEAEIDHDLT